LDPGSIERYIVIKAKIFRKVFQYETVKKDKKKEES